jgi:hypothetical protein
VGAIKPSHRRNFRNHLKNVSGGSRQVIITNAPETSASLEKTRPEAMMWYPIFAKIHFVPIQSSTSVPIQSIKFVFSILKLTLN